MTKIINLFKFIEKMKPEYPVPFKRKLISDPDSLTADELNVDRNRDLRNLDLRYTSIKSLPDNLTVSGFLDLSNTAITTLPENLTVDGDLFCYSTKITSLPKNLKITVGGDLNLYAAKIKSLPNNLTVGGDLLLMSTINTQSHYRGKDSLYKLYEIIWKLFSSYISRVINPRYKQQHLYIVS
jgi:Leucine-rich repeat (LRR) protein